jgi:hypothetical protein
MGLFSKDPAEAPGPAVVKWDMNKLAPENAVTVIRDSGRGPAWWVGMDGKCEHCDTVIQLNASAVYSAYFVISWKPRWVEYPCPSCETPIHFDPPQTYFYRLPFSTIGVPSRLHSARVRAILLKLQALEATCAEIVLDSEETEIFQHLFAQPDLWRTI